MLENVTWLLHRTYDTGIKRNGLLVRTDKGTMEVDLTDKAIVEPSNVSNTDWTVRKDLAIDVRMPKSIAGTDIYNIIPASASFENAVAAVMNSRELKEKLRVAQAWKRVSKKRVADLASQSPDIFTTATGIRIRQNEEKEES
tara:strand:+ start:14327 stop:14752 length:426 start_codon:yes stop_codon:yes gene_type:complete